MTTFATKFAIALEGSCCSLATSMIEAADGRSRRPENSSMNPSLLSLINAAIFCMHLLLKSFDSLWVSSRATVDWYNSIAFATLWTSSPSTWYSKK